MTVVLVIYLPTYLCDSSDGSDSSDSSDTSDCSMQNSALSKQISMDCSNTSDASEGDWVSEWVSE